MLLRHRTSSLTAIVTFLGLTACASTPPPAPRPGPDPEPDHRKLIAENLKTLFSAEAHVRNVVVSELRQMPSAAGLVPSACVRVSAVNMNQQRIAPRTYVVTFSRGVIAERRPATGKECADASYSPLSG